MPSDGQRAPLVDYLLLHHSVGPIFFNSSDQEVSDWFNSVGKNRGYAGLAHSGHYDPDTGKETFAQAHWALHPYTLDGNPYGWRMTLLIKDPHLNVAWHAGNWQVNQRSFGVEICGTYLDNGIPDGALRLLGDFFRDWDRIVIKKDPAGLNVFGHRAFFATQCPGKIWDQIPQVISYINADGAAPQPATFDLPLNTVDLKFNMARPIQMFNMLTGKGMHNSGDFIHITRVTNQAAVTIDGIGHTMYIPVDRVEKIKTEPYGFKEKDIYDNRVVPKPEPTPPPPPPVLTADQKIEAIERIIHG